MRSGQSVLVLDGSAAVDLVLRRPRRAAWVAEHVRRGGSLHAPHLLDVEVVSALRRLVRTEALSAARAEQALDLFTELRVVRHAPRVLLTRIWGLKDILSAYDATYVALAEALNAPLLTTDDRLSRSTGHRAALLGFAG